MRIPVDNRTSYRGRNARPNWATLGLFVGVALGAGAIGFLFSPAHSPAAAHWYAGLAKPPWTAPSRWFGPVWIALYCLMGTAAWLVSRERYHERRGAAILAYFLQLILNAAWAPLFFGAGNIGAGLFIMVALWLALASPTLLEDVDARELRRLIEEACDRAAGGGRPESLRLREFLDGLQSLP